MVGIPSLKLPNCPWKMMVGSWKTWLVSFWDGIFLGGHVMLNFRWLAASWRWNWRKKHPHLSLQASHPIAKQCPSRKGLGRKRAWKQDNLENTWKYCRISASSLIEHWEFSKTLWEVPSQKCFIIIVIVIVMSFQQKPSRKLTGIPPEEKETIIFKIAIFCKGYVSSLEGNHLVDSDRLGMDFFHPSLHLQDRTRRKSWRRVPVWQVTATGCRCEHLSTSDTNLKKAKA